MRRLPLSAAALALVVGLAALVAPWASSAPDGLERVARDQGFAGAERIHPAQRDAPLAGYAAPGVENERTATGVAGVAGTLGVFGLALAGAQVLRRRSARRARPRAPTTAG